jgi:hypothetical protein
MGMLDCTTGRLGGSILRSTYSRINPEPMMDRGKHTDEFATHIASESFARLLLLAMGSCSLEWSGDGATWFHRSWRASNKA